MKFKTFVCTVLIALSLSNCKKDKEMAMEVCTQTMSKVAGTYYFIKAEKTDIASPGVFVDITSQSAPCSFDNKIILNADGTAAYEDVGVICSSAPTITGIWEMASPDSITIRYFPIVVALYADNSLINFFDCTTLIYTWTNSSNGQRTRITLKK